VTAIDFLNSFTTTFPSDLQFTCGWSLQVRERQKVPGCQRMPTYHISREYLKATILHRRRLEPITIQ